MRLDWLPSFLLLAHLICFFIKWIHLEIETSGYGINCSTSSNNDASISSLSKKIRIVKKVATPKPVEELIPPPLQKELIKNFHFINELLKKGKDKTISYDESRHVSEIITIYFHEKYKQNCPMYPIKTYNQFEQEPNLLPQLYEKHKKKYTLEALKVKLIDEEKSYFIDWNIEKFLKNLALSVIEIIFF